MPWLIFFGVFAAVFVIVLLWLVLTYNKFVRYRLNYQGAWSQIDVQLKRRYDLIPNLVETVKGYASHEKGTLDAVISARAKAVATHDASNQSVAAMGKAEGELTQALGRLIAVAEAYPDLKANQNFAALQEELTSTENKIGFSRQHYNDTVGRFEELRQSFPSNIVAGIFNFNHQDFLEFEDRAAIAEAPKVSFA